MPSFRSLLPFSRTLSFRNPSNSRYGSELITLVKKLIGLGISLSFLFSLKLLIELQLSTPYYNISNAKTVGMQAENLNPTRRVVLEPGSSYPIDSELYNKRIASIKSQKSLKPKNEIDFGLKSFAFQKFSSNNEKPSVSVVILSDKAEFVDPIIRTFLDPSSFARKSISISKITIRSCASEQSGDDSVGCAHMCTPMHQEDSSLYTWMISNTTKAFQNKNVLESMIGQVNCTKSLAAERSVVSEMRNFQANGSLALDSFLTCSNLYHFACVTMENKGVFPLLESDDSNGQMLHMVSTLNSACRTKVVSIEKQIEWPQFPQFCPPSDPSAERVLFLVHNDADASFLLELFAEFERKKFYEAVFVASEDVNISKLTKRNVKDCNIFAVQEKKWASDGYAEWVAKWSEVLQLHAPLAIFSVEHHTKEPLNKAVIVAIKQLAKINLNIAWISIPQKDTSSASWIADLSPRALSNWNSPYFTISVAVENASQSNLLELLESLKNAHLYGARLPIDFFVENTADNSVLRLVQNFTEDWAENMEAQVKFRLLPGGKLRSVTELFYPSNMVHHFCITLTGFMKVSPMIFAWVKMGVLNYQYGTEGQFSKDLYGLSLSAMTSNCESANLSNSAKRRKVGVSNEGTMSQLSWDSKEVALPTVDAVFKHQMPCDAGMVLFPEYWAEFRAYLAARLLEDHIVAEIGGSVTNQWRTTWQRFLTEMAFQSNYYLLYPNLKGREGFVVRGEGGGPLDSSPGLIEDAKMLRKLFGNEKDAERFNALGSRVL